MSQSFSPPDAGQVQAHLTRWLPQPVSLWLVRMPWLVLIAAAGLGLLAGGVIGAALLTGLSWLGLIGWSAQRARATGALERQVNGLGEQTLLRHYDVALRRSWLLLPALVHHPTLHGQTAAVMAHCLGDLGEHEAAMAAYDHLLTGLPDPSPMALHVRLNRAIAALQSDHLVDADQALRQARGQLPPAPAPAPGSFSRTTEHLGATGGDSGEGSGGAEARFEEAADRAGGTSGDTSGGGLYRLALLLQDVQTHHFADALSFEPALLADLRPLGVRAGYGYALMALCCLNAPAADPAQADGQRQRARWWWSRATSLIPVATLVRFSPPLASLIDLPGEVAPPPVTPPSVERFSGATRSPGPSVPAAALARPGGGVGLASADASQDRTTPPGPPAPPKSPVRTRRPFTPGRLAWELGRDTAMRWGLWLAVLAGSLMMGFVWREGWETLVLAGGVVLAGGGWLWIGFRSAAAIRALPEVTARIETDPAAADRMLGEWLGPRPLLPRARLMLYQRLAALRLAQHRFAEAAQIAGAVLARVDAGPATVLLLARARLECGDLVEAYGALTRLYMTRLTLAQALERMSLATRYEVMTGHDAAALRAVDKKVAMAELLPPGPCGMMHALLAVAATRAGQRERANWLWRRVDLLCEPAQAARYRAWVAGGTGGGEASGARAAASHIEPSSLCAGEPSGGDSGGGSGGAEARCEEAAERAGETSGGGGVA